MEQRTRHTGWSLPRKSKEKWRKKREAVSRKEEGEAEATYRKKEKKRRGNVQWKKKSKKEKKKRATYEAHIYFEEKTF